MKENENADFAATDSGYPTPRDDLPSSSRSESPPRTAESPLTSTPVRNILRRPLKDHFESRQDLSMIASEASYSSDTEPNRSVIDGTKHLINLVKGLKQRSRENLALREENETLREENETLREETRRMELENASIRQEEKPDGPFIPKLVFDEPSEHVKLEDFKKELLSFIKSEEERTLVENQLEHMRIDLKHPKVFTTSTTIQVDTEKMDADVQTDKDDHVNVINTNLKIELDQIHSELEIKNKNYSELQNRLFDFEKLKEKFEEDEQKLREDLEKKLKKSKEKVEKGEARIEELELRLKNKRKELEEVSAENKRLVDDRATHDFELDEMRVHMEDVEKKKRESDEKVEKLTQDVAQVEERLEDERKTVQQLESTIEDLKKEHKEVVDELEKKKEEAVLKESEALKQLLEIQEENKAVVKENKYLSEANQILVESEINLKGTTSEMDAKLRIAQNQLEDITQKLAQEEEKRKSAESDIFNLELLNQELEEDKREKVELLGELKKSKLEFDYLREQLVHAAQGGEEMKKMKNELLEEKRKGLEIEERLSTVTKEKNSMSQQLEDLMHSEALKILEIDMLKKGTEEQKGITQNLEKEVKNLQETMAVGEKQNIGLQQSLEQLQHEYAEFKEHAMMQYNDQIGLRDQQIKDLHERLVEVVSYPGQTISVMKKSAEVQTEEIPEERSPHVSLRSEEDDEMKVSLEENLLSLIERMVDLSGGRRLADLSQAAQREAGAEEQSSETFMQVVEILQRLLDERRVPSKELDTFWNELNQRMTSLFSLFDERLHEYGREIIRRNRSDEDMWKGRVDVLEMELAQTKQTSQNRYEMAKELHELYEQECDDFNKRERDYQDEINALITKVNVEVTTNDAVREELEKAQHTVEKLKRAKITVQEDYEAQIAQLEGALKKTSEDKARQKKSLKEEILELQRKRAYDKVSMKQMIDGFSMMEEKFHYIRNRNTQRQKLLDHMQKVMRDVARNNRNGSNKWVEQLECELNQSNLVHLGSREVEDGNEVSVDAGSETSSQRKVLADKNRAHH